MGKKGIETLVGLFVLLGFLALVFLALQAANLATLTRGDTFTVTARFAPRARSGGPQGPSGRLATSRAQHRAPAARH